MHLASRHTASLSSSSNGGLNNCYDISLRAVRLQGNHITDKGALCFSQLLNSKPKSQNSNSSNGNSNRSRASSPSIVKSVTMSGSFDNLDISNRFNNNNGTNPANDKCNFRINLRELNISDNPVGPLGISSLLGNFSQGILSPLTTLLAAHCIGYGNTVDYVEEVLGIFSLLSNNIRLAPSYNLTKLVFDFTEQSAELFLDEYLRVSAHKPMHPSLCEVFQNAADTLLNVNNQNNINLSRIRLGAFHQVLFRYCVDAANSSVHGNNS